MRSVKGSDNKKIIVLTWTRKGELPLFMQNLPKITNNVTGFVSTKRYVKLPRPFKTVITNFVGINAIRVLQKRLIHRGEWVVIVHPKVILPSNFFEVVESECTDPDAIYGAERRHYHTFTEHKKTEPFDAMFFEDGEIAHGYLQIYWNGSRYGPKDKTYPVDGTDICFRNRWKKIVKLPLYVDYIYN